MSGQVNMSRSSFCAHVFTSACCGSNNGAKAGIDAGYRRPQGWRRDCIGKGQLRSAPSVTFHSGWICLFLAGLAKARFPTRVQLVCTVQRRLTERGSWQLGSGLLTSGGETECNFSSWGYPHKVWNYSRSSVWKVRKEESRELWLPLNACQLGEKTQWM